MKLNAVKIDQYGILNHFQLSNLKAGFNLIYGGNGSGKTTLSRYVRNVLYGFQSEEMVNGGHIDVASDGLDSRLVRDRATANELVSNAPSFGSNGYSEQASCKPPVLRSVGARAFDSVFCVSGRDSSQNVRSVSELLIDMMGVPVGKLAFGNECEFAAFARQESEFRARLMQIEEKSAALQMERGDVARNMERLESEFRMRGAGLENEIAELATRLQRYDLGAAREQIAVLDAEISTLRIRLEQNQDRVEYVSRPYAPSDSLAILYRRLDEVDQQIRRWRNVHSDVQQQRVQLKDEMTVWNSMTVDSNEHPYHRSREILRDIESRIAGAESTIHQFRNNQDGQNAHIVIENMQSCFGELRSDVYTLCDELGNQYKNIRHRAAAAELKRLRRCYHEIGENIDALIKHRHCILEDVRLLDPAGASAIARADHDFCSCAQHDGYLHARRKFVGEVTAPVPEVVKVGGDDSGTARLRDLENLRIAKVRDLVVMENEKNELESLLAEKRAAREGMSIDSSASLRDRLIRIDSELQPMESEQRSVRQQLEQLRSVPSVPANPMILSACEFIERLTMGEIRRLWFSAPLATAATHVPVHVEQKSGKQIEFEYLGSGLQQQVMLALCLAAAEHFRNSGMEMPLILDDVFVNLDPELIRHTLELLIDFSRKGNQVLALTSDRTVLELCHARQEAVFDLPDTSFSPSVPLWTPDRRSDEPVREPDFLTPFTTRQHTQLPTRPLSYPLVKYPSAGPFFEHSATNFDAVETNNGVRDVYESSVGTVTPLQENSITESSRLETLRICGSDQINRLSQLGLETVGDLLELNPHQLPETFTAMGFQQSELDAWQAVVWLLICVPALNVEDAQILSVIGIHEPEQLESTHSQQLVDRISKYLNSSEGRRHAERQRSFSRDTINRWYDSLAQTRSSWRMASGYSRRNRWRSNRKNEVSESRDRQRHRSEDRAPRVERVSFSMNREARSPRESRPRRDRSHRDDRLESAVNRFSRQPRESESSRSYSQSNSPKSEPSASSKSATDQSNVELKFYLDMSDQLEAAPSIGPKTAERFVKIGVRTVGEFLTQTAESMAPKINYKRITAEVIRTWQHQARLVCRIPNLRGHDAQLLVACDIVDPEDLAARSPNSLFAIVEPFAESKEGLKIIRGGKQPDLEEITDWINWAKDTRSLQAA